MTAGVGRWRRVCWGLVLATGLPVLAAEPPKATIGVFPQEVSQQVTQIGGEPLVDPRNLLIDDQGAVHLRTETAHWMLKADGDWGRLATEAFPLANQVVAMDGQWLLATDDGVSRWANGQQQVAGLVGVKVNSLAVSVDGRQAAATEDGAFETDAAGEWLPLEIYDAVGRQWGVRDVRVVVYDNRGQLWVGQPAGLACRTEQGWVFYEGRDGLPYADFTSAAAGSDGRIWFGTRIGLVGWDNGRWLYRQGKRFLPGDEVRSVVVAADGTPWVATDGGLAALTSKPMRLADKASFYEDQIDRYIKRTPFGYTSEVNLREPADLSHIIYTDSDNDGLWTAMYGASQCYAAAVTGSDQHKAAAKQAFEAIRFLQTVTQGGQPSPPPGYIARTILPTDGPDPNEGRVERDRRARATSDRLWKVYDPRWPVSADGQWYWKSDTSSDELDGHYYFLPLYYDLVAQDESEKERVREVVRDLTDHLLGHNFQLVDVDGTPTRWAVFNPENINQNRDWWAGRGLNSLSIMTYLTVAEHITGDARYGRALEILRREHSYEANAMVAKVQYGIGSGNQSDDEMAMMCFYSLIKYTPDAELRRNMLYSMYTYWRLMQPERNPFFNFTYAVHGLGATHETPYGEYPIEPWDGWLEDAMQTLTSFPLDRLNWSHRNSHRLDLVELPRQSRGDPGERAGRGRGHLVDGKVLPVENRHFNHWNTDPWRFDYGGDGRQLASGTVFLLPYWLGRYYSFIDEQLD